MKLSLVGIANQTEWKQKGYSVPEFELGTMKKKTKENPVWIHFGAGNIFRAFQANAMQGMLNRREFDRGLIVAEGYDYEIISKMNRKCDDLSILATLKANGTVEKTVVGSIAESLRLDTNEQKEYSRLKEIFRNASLQMVTFTITEKGYSLTDGKGELLPAVKEDMEAGPEEPQSYIGKVTALLYERFLNNELPIAMVSMDNCSHNGDKLRSAVTEMARGWSKNCKADERFAIYLENPAKVSFPWTMIDKITPRPDESVLQMLKKDGLEDMDAVVTSKNTYIAPFVNAEECEYLVIEDDFPNGRPSLEKAGFLFTDRETVDKIERMKVCTCLNPLHTALAVYGCLLGYTKISEEMKDKELVNMIHRIGYIEGMPVVVDPGIINPKEFLDTVVNVRIPNPFMPDTPQRIATDTSQKIPIRFGQTVVRYYESSELDVKNLQMIPLVFAGWLRYLMGVNDNGERMELSSDPMLERLCPIFEKVELGKEIPNREEILSILKEESIFGMDLQKAGISDKVLGYFEELIQEKGAVRKTLQKYCK